jgi:hypothetical protein
MQYPLVILISTVQLDEQSDIAVRVHVSSDEESPQVQTWNFRLRPLDTPEDVEDYARMAVAAVCEAL